jgi:hypothetical protein
MCWATLLTKSDELSLSKCSDFLFMIVYKWFSDRFYGNAPLLFIDIGLGFTMSRAEFEWAFWKGYRYHGGSNVPLSSGVLTLEEVICSSILGRIIFGRGHLFLHPRAYLLWKMMCLELTHHFGSIMSLLFWFYLHTSRFALVLCISGFRVTFVTS